MALLPPSTNYTSPAATQGDKKTFVAAMRTYLSDLLGTDSSNKAAARAALGAAASGANSDIISLAGLTSINGGQLGGFRNRLINGNFSINQRVVSGTVILAAGAYGHDRWKAGTGGCTYTFSTLNNITTITISAGTLMQVVEGSNVNGGVHVLSNAGTAQARIAVSGTATSGAYAACPLASASANGGQTVTVEFTTGTLSRAQLEIGTTPSAFEHRFFGSELALCQRYYEKSYPNASSPGTATADGYTRFSFGAASSIVFGTAEFKVNKRAIPTVRVWDQAANLNRLSFHDAGTGAIADNLNALASNWGGTNRWGFSANTSTAGATGTYFIHWDAEAEL